MEFLRRSLEAVLVSALASTVACGPSNPGIDCSPSVNQILTQVSLSQRLVDQQQEPGIVLFDFKTDRRANLDYIDCVVKEVEDMGGYKLRFYGGVMGENGATITYGIEILPNTNASKPNIAG